MGCLTLLIETAVPKQKAGSVLLSACPVLVMSCSTCGYGMIKPVPCLKAALHCFHKKSLLAYDSPCCHDYPQHRLSNLQIMKHTPMAGCAELLSAAAKAASDVETLETLAEVQALEQQKEERVEKLRHSAAETMQIVKESIGDSSAETLIASHSHVSTVSPLLDAVHHGLVCAMRRCHCWVCCACWRALACCLVHAKDHSRCQGAR